MSNTRRDSTSIAKPIKILIIDDSEVLLERAKRALAAAGYVVTTTTQASGNARHIPNHDLVLIDFHMPGIDGGTVITALRAARSKEHHCLFYLYTSDAQIEADYAKLGFDGLLLNKGDDEALVRQVDAVARIVQLRMLRSKKGP